MKEGEGRKEGRRRGKGACLKKCEGGKGWRRRGGACLERGEGRMRVGEGAWEEKEMWEGEEGVSGREGEKRKK